MYHTLGTLRSPSPLFSHHCPRRNDFQPHQDPWMDTTLCSGPPQRLPQCTMFLSPPLWESRDGDLHNTAVGRRQTSGSMLSLSRTAQSTGTNQASPETKVRVIMEDNVCVYHNPSNLLWTLMISCCSLLEINASQKQQAVLWLVTHMHHCCVYTTTPLLQCLFSTVAIAVLKDKEPGTFLIRDSNSFQGAYGLALKVATPPPNANVIGSKGIHYECVVNIDEPVLTEEAHVQIIKWMTAEFNWSASVQFHDPGIIHSDSLSHRHDSLGHFHRMEPLLMLLLTPVFLQLCQAITSAVKKAIVGNSQITSHTRLTNYV